MLTPAVQHLDLAQTESLVAEAQRVLSEEAAALYDCCARIDEPQFALACRLIAESTGRVVVTGMGKSGAMGENSRARFPAPAPRRTFCTLPKRCMAMWE